MPIALKTAIITPLYKEGDRNLASNYRPISVLPVISKVMERLIHDQVYDHIREHGLLSEAQFGFRKHHSTTTCILKLLDHIYLNMDKGMMTGVVFLDLKKAFDTVDHEILLHKLISFNLSVESVLWFKSYLSGRRQSVKSKGIKSDYLPIKCGVPQGSILGPLLFIIYINDLYKYLTECSISLYADDTALYTSAKTQIEIMLNFQLELSLVQEWLNANKLTLNASKTKYVIFGSRHLLTTKPDLNLVGGNKIERVSSMKYLGVILDEFLTFDEHINYILTKSSKKLGILRRARDYLNKNTKILLYKSLVLPHLDYCDLVYMCTTEQNLQKIQQIQNSACRTILQADIDTPTVMLHKELNLPTMKQRRHIHMAMECFNNIKNEEAGLHKMFKPIYITRIRTTRSENQNLMNVANTRSVNGRKAFSYRGPHFWNNIENDARLLETKGSFKAHITKLICRDVNHPG